MDLSYLSVATEIVLVLGAVLVLMIDVFKAPSVKVHGVLVGGILLVATGFTFWQWDRVVDTGSSFGFGAMVRLDRPAVVVKFILIGVAAMGLVAAWEMMTRLGPRLAEGVALVLVATAGFMMMGSSANLMMIFLALEIGSISLYVLAGIARENPSADEAALKYFLLGAFASAIFVYGVALVFASTGELNLYGVGAFLAENVVLKPAVLLIGMALLIVGMAFKVTAAPFHAWAPDVYQGAPAGIVGFMAAAAKVGGFAALARILIVGFARFESAWADGLAALAVLSVITGTLFAIQQTDLRRLLAYSGVAHAGFILTGLTAGSDGLDGVWFYLATYVVMLVGSFAIAALLGSPTGSGVAIEAFRGLGTRSPLLAAPLAVFMLGMSGLPLTTGFVGKFTVFTDAWVAGYGWLVIVGLLASVAGFFFYLRLIVTMYFEAPVLAEAPGTAAAQPDPSFAVKVVLIGAVVVTLVLGAFPSLLLDLVADALPF